MGDDMIDELREKKDRMVDIVGVGGDKIEERGIKSFLEKNEIEIMGMGEIMKKMKGMMMSIRKKERKIVVEKKDCVMLIERNELKNSVEKKIRD